MVCERAESVKLPNNILLICKLDCPICGGAGWTEEAVVKMSEVEKWAENMANTDCGSPAMPYEQGMSRAGRLLLYWLFDKRCDSLKEVNK